ncbi:MAG: hypothetical protein EOP52_12740 [Sphingobacteriales bacterium]|nr:MAG: hypothetical protein EOP52_12740 [Sphingobacteriales bacterium]
MRFAQRLLLLAISLLSSLLPARACSGYKVTLGTKTMVGANEDAWRMTSQIWFETATATAPIGAMFTGSRFDGANGHAPQSGLNEAGLCFQRLASPVGTSKPAPVGPKPIENQTLYLKTILHQCKTVEEVAQFIRQYRQSDFPGDVFLYIDKSGRYLTVEPYALTLGAEPKYVISNFCPSSTPLPEANKLERYRNGAAFLGQSLDTTLAFCQALSDTMHVCRPKVGDGTLLTSIYDLNAGAVNLYFYHDYQHTARFSLQDELQQGDHSILIPSLFPANAEFERLRTYQTPQNNPNMLFSLLACIGLFSFSTLYFNVRAFRNKDENRLKVLALIPAGLFLSYYLFSLVRDAGPFFFAAPYKDPHSLLLSLASYLPFGLLLAIVPLTKMVYNRFRNRSTGVFTTLLTAANLLAIGMLICFFGYWGFYAIAS